MLQVNGTQLYSRTIGHGPRCLVLHGGLGFDHTILSPWLDPLAEHVALTYVDLRGHGASTPVDPNTVTLKELASDIEAIRVVWDVPRIGLIGHSVGAAVALEYALRWPQHLSHLVLVTPVWDMLFGPASLEHVRRKGATDQMLRLLSL